MKNEFLSSYLKIFNEDGTSNYFTREQSIRLIEKAEKLCPNVPKGTFGSVRTGFLNKTKLKELYHLCIKN